MLTCDYCEAESEGLHYCVDDHVFCSEDIDTHSEKCFLGCTAPHDCEA